MDLYIPKFNISEKRRRSFRLVTVYFFKYLIKGTRDIGWKAGIATSFSQVETFTKLEGYA